MGKERECHTEMATPNIGRFDSLSRKWGNSVKAAQNRIEVISRNPYMTVIGISIKRHRAEAQRYLSDALEGNLPALVAPGILTLTRPERLRHSL